MADRGKILFATVGTGNIEDLEKTLLIPLKKSILKGEWQEVVLLPSQETARSAQLLHDELQGIPIVMEPLPGSGQENDADKTYAHFEKVIAGRIAAGTPPERMVADFTRGTKAMSAALVLAASRYDIPRLRYIVGQRGKTGNVIAGTEDIHEFPTRISSGHRLLDQALLVMKKGNFAAVLDILPDVSGPMAGVWPDDVKKLSRFGRAAAAFYAAWDRLDYAEAGKLLGGGLPECPDKGWECFVPGTDVCKHVRRLAETKPDLNEECADWVRVRAVDLLANGERRIRDRQFEDAYLRAYRVLELIGQARLFMHGLDSGQLPPEHPAVQELKAKLKENESGFGVIRKTGNYTAPRELSARLLKVLGDPMGARLLKVGEGDFVKARNRSLLIHGFSATRMSSDEELRKIYAELENLLLEDSAEAASALEAARSADFSAKEGRN